MPVPLFETDGAPNHSLLLCVRLSKKRLQLSLAAADGARRDLIDCEEDRVLRAVLVGMLREADRRRRQ